MSTPTLMCSPKTPPEGAVVLAGGPPTLAPPLGAPTPRRLLSTSLSALLLLALLPSSAFAQAVPVKEFSLFTSTSNPRSGQAAALGDLNGDGFLDIFWANTNGEPNQVSLNTAGSGTDGFSLATPAGLGNQDSQGVALGDIDNDGDLDAFVANVGQNHVWFNDGAGNFTQGAQNIGLKDSRAVALGDLNGDGRLDAFVVNSDSDAVYLYNTSTNLFATNNQVNLDTAQGTGVVLHDFDGDGDLDAVISNNNEPSALFENDGTGSFSQLLTFTNSDKARGVELVDLNGDGLMDLYFARDNNLDDTIALNTTDMAATPVVVSFSTQAPSGVAAHNSSGVAFADTDNDGAVDLAVITVDDSVLANSGNIVYDVTVGATPTFTARANPLGAARSTDVVLGDLDNDGDIDAFVTNFGAPHTWWHMKLAPTAADDTDSVDEDGVRNRGAAGGALANDTDPEGFLITNVTLVSDVSHGTLTLNANGSYDYTPTANFFGTDSFTYKTSDGTQESNVATVTITVNNVNDAPVATDDSATLDEDDFAIVTPIVSDVDNDTVPGTDTFSFSVTQQPMTAGGTAGDAGSAEFIDGDLVYTPAENFNGTATVIYEVNDGSGADNATDTATVTFTVNALNDAPVASDATPSLDEDSSINFDLFAVPDGATDPTAYDVDGDSLTVTIDIDVSHGTTSLNGGVITYTPTGNFNGTDDLHYTVDDGNGGTDSGVITFTVNPLDDGPVTAVSESYTTNEDVAVSGNVLDNEDNTIDPNETLTVVLITPPAIGTLTLNEDGTFTYTPALNNNGATFFRYKVFDGTSNSTTPATASIVINAVNDAAVAVNDDETIDEDADPTLFDVLANDTDVDDIADALSIYELSAMPTIGTASVVNGQIEYTPDADANGSDTIKYYVTDGHTLFEQAGESVVDGDTNEYVIEVPQATTLVVELSCTVGDTVLRLYDDQLVEIAADDDNDGTCSRVIVDVAAGEYLAEVGNFDPVASQADYSVNAFMVDEGTVNVTVTPVNDDPVGTDKSTTTNEDTNVTVNALAGATDVDGTPSLGSCTDGTIGTTVLGPNPGEVTYTPTADLNSPADLSGADDTFTCDIVDGDGGSDTITVSVTVNPVNDPPTATDDTATVDEDNNIDVLVLDNDSDVDGDSISLVSCTDGTNGSTTESNNIVTYSPNLNFNGTDTFTCTISDGVLTSDSTVTVTVNSVNDNPTLNSDPQTLTVDEETVGPVMLAAVVDDVEDDNGTLTISIEPGQEPANGTVQVVSGQMITYEGDLNFVGADSFGYTVTDANGGTVTGTVNVTVNNVNDDPVGEDKTLTTAEDTNGTVNVLTNASDVDPGDTVSIDGCGDGANGSTALGINPGEVVYSPNADYNGGDSFTCDLTDGNGGFDTITVTVTVTAVNDEPVAVADSDTTAEETPVTIDITGNDDDLENDTLKVVSCTSPGNGTIGAIAEGDTSITYTPTTNFNGDDTFSCTISDGDLTSSATVTVTVTPVNDDPTPSDDTLTVTEDQSNSVNVVTNDTDPDAGDTVSLESCTDGTNGTTTESGNTVTYTPSEDFYGSDSFTCTVTDGNGGSATSTVNVTITPVNDPPTGLDDEYPCDEDTTLTANYDEANEFKGVLANDDDDDNLSAPFYAGLTVRLVTPPIAGELNLAADGSFTYTPELHSNDNVAFVYELIDNDEAQTPTGELYFAFITINPINDRPVAVNDGPFELNEDTLDFPIDVLANDTDVANENQTLTVVSVTQPANGTVTITNGGADVSYTPNADYYGPDSFTYIISDGTDNSVNAATVSLQVNNVPDAPVAVDDPEVAGELFTDEEVALAVTPLANDTDADVLEGTPVLSIVGLNGQAVAVDTPTDVGDAIVTIEENSGFYMLNVEPKLNFQGTLSFTYTVSDNDGATADDEGTITIVVNNVNDAPVAAAQNYNGTEDITFDGLAGDLMMGAVDPDPNNTHTAQLVADSAVGGTAVVNPDGSFTFTPERDVNGDVSFEYLLIDQDGAQSAPATVTITLAPVNDAPVAVADNGNSVDEEQTFVINPVSNDTDVDGDELTLVAVTLVEPASAGIAQVVDQSGTLVVEFTGTQDFAGDVTITYSVTDGELTSEGTISVTVNNVNDAPVAVDDSFVDGAEDVPYVAATPLEGVLANDQDADLYLGNETVTVSLVADSAVNGSVELGPDGTFTFTPNADFNGDASFRYLLTDAAGATSNEGTVTITFAPVNDAPRPVADAFVGGVEEVEFVVGVANSVLNNDLDIDVNDTFTAHLVDGSEVGGAATVNPDGSFSFMPAANFYGEASFSYIARDQANADSVPVTVTIAFSNVADAPVAVNDPAVGEEAEYVVDEDNTLTVNAGSGLLLNDFDVDNQPLSSNGLIASVVTEPTHGQVNLEDDGSFTYVPAADYNGPDSFTYVVNDGALVSNTATVNLVVNPVNDAPVGAADSFTTAEDQPLIVAAIDGVLINDSDIDDDRATLTAELVENTPVAHGVAAVEPDGSVTFTPAANYNGTTSFTYQAIDPSGARSELTTVTITVTPVNDEPIAAADSYTVEEDRTLTVNAPGVRVNDVDVDGNPLTVALATNVSNGQLTFNPNGSFTYVPNANFNGQDSFTYTANDGVVDSQPAEVIITVTAVNDAPVAIVESYSTNEDEALTVLTADGLLANDTDTDNDPLTAVLVQAPPASEGTLALAADGGFVFTPALNFNGPVSFTYQANDGTDSSNVISVSITVNAVNDAPVARADSFVTPEDSVLTRPAAAGLLANDTDVDAGDSFSVVGNTSPANGTLSIDADGAFTYVPNANFNGDDSFSYTIRDQSGEEASATVSITIGGSNDAPVAANDVNLTEEDTAVSGNVLDNDTDVDNEALTAQLIQGPEAAQGALVFNADGSYTFTPALNFNGTARFTYQALDVNNVSSNVAEVIITVSAVNDAPVAVNDTITTYIDPVDGVRNIEEDTPFTVPAPGVLSNDTDVDSANLSVSVQDAPANGVVELNADGSFTYAPNADFNGQDSFTYVVNDGELDSAPATVTLTVRAVNDVPVGEADSYSVEEEGTLVVELADGLLSNDSDVDGNTLSAVLVDDPENNGILELEGGVVTLAADGSFTFVANLDFTGDVTFSYTANDATSSSEPVVVTITVTPVNDAPVAIADVYEAAEDTTLVIDAAAGVLANDVDVDGDVLTADFLSQPTAEQGVLAFNVVDGSFTFEPAPDFTGEVTFTYVALDAELPSEPATVTILVLPTNDAPVGEVDSYEMDEDSTLEVSAAEGVLANDTDVDSAPETFVATLESSPAQGELTFNNDGSFTYTPEANANGEVTFTYSVSDGVNSAEPTTVTIMINAVNDAPTFVEPTPEGERAAAEGVELSFVLSAEDVDGDELTFSMSGLPAGASLDSDTGVFSWTPTWEEAGVYTVTFNVTDGELSDARDLTITVSFTDADEDGLADTWEESVGLSTESADSDGDTISDAVEVGDNIDEPSNVDGDELIDALDDDSDNDGLSDADEAGDADLTTDPIDSDEDGVADFRDTDSDNDGVDDGEDTCPTVDNDQEADLDADGIGDACDSDLDGDGLSNELEEALALNPTDADSDGDTINDGAEFGEGEEAADTDNDGDIDALDLDSDDDGISDADEAGDAELATEPVDTDADGVADFRDTDSDDDGVEDDADNCRLVENGDQSDIDMNDVGDLCDGDIDGDGVDNEADNCELVANADQADLDEDGEGDVCDGDVDGDGVDNDSDNCVDLANDDQADLDEDGEGDACDSDVDGDNVSNDSDNCELVANADQADTDGDGEGDVCDSDLDGDGVDNDSDNCPNTPNEDQADADEDNIGDLCDEETDADGDGVNDAADNCPNASNEDQTDTDEDDIGDVCDEDIDGDGVNNSEDNCELVANADQADADGDDVGDACDEDNGEAAPKPDSGCDQNGRGELPMWSLLLFALAGLVTRRRRVA